MMSGTRVRIRNLSRAFGYGKSEMYNRIAQICVLYEDLRIETGRLFEFVEALMLEGEVKKTFEALTTFGGQQPASWNIEARSISFTPMRNSTSGCLLCRRSSRITSHRLVGILRRTIS
jgi:hypothetical protein